MKLELNNEILHNNNLSLKLDENVMQKDSLINDINYYNKEFMDK